MLDIRKNKKQINKYFLITIFFLVFGLIYEKFSHQVYSMYMMYAFLIPLFLGVIVYGIIFMLDAYKYLSDLGMQFYNSSIITFTIGSIMNGVLEIYGTTNSLVLNYLIVGIILFVSSIVCNSFYNIKRKESDVI